jgi:predicted RNA methylase
MNTITQLKELYSKNSKHSNYQILSDKLTSIIGSDQIDVKSRYERERLDYILKNIQVKEKSVLDIGGNSGFFTFEAIEHGAKSVHHFEGNKEHSEFVSKAAEVLKCTDSVEVTNGYYAFGSEDSRKYDVVFLLNVLHHLGDDFGGNTLSIGAAKELMMSQLNNMVSKSNYIVFQLGFCWKGDRNIGLFEHGTKKELIDFIKNSVDGVWDIKNIGIPAKEGDHIQYVDRDDQNILRDDSLGEFLNRPLFIMKAK